MRVLIIDDENDLRRIAHIALERIGGMEVIEAATGAEGVAAARAYKPDLILLDVMMPGIDGPTTLELLRHDPLTEPIPVIFLTAKAMPSEIERLRALGACGVITKPFAPFTLAAQAKALAGGLRATAQTEDSQAAVPQ